MAIYKHRLWISALCIVVWLCEWVSILVLDMKLFMDEIWQHDILSGKCFNSIGAWNITDHILGIVRPLNMRVSAHVNESQFSHDPNSFGYNNTGNVWSKNLKASPAYSNHSTEQYKPTELHAYNMKSTFSKSCTDQLHVNIAATWVCDKIINMDECKNVLSDLFQCRYDCGSQGWKIDKFITLQTNKLSNVLHSLMFCLSQNPITYGGIVNWLKVHYIGFT